MANGPGWCQADSADEQRLTFSDRCVTVACVSSLGEKVPEELFFAGTLKFQEAQGGRVAGLPCSLPGAANRTSGWQPEARTRAVTGMLPLSGRRCVSRASADAARCSIQPPMPPMGDLGPRHPARGRSPQPLAVCH